MADITALEFRARYHDRFVALDTDAITARIGEAYRLSDISRDATLAMIGHLLVLDGLSSDSPDGGSQVLSSEQMGPLRNTYRTMSAVGGDRTVWLEQTWFGRRVIFFEGRSPAMALPVLMPGMSIPRGSGVRDDTSGSGRPPPSDAIAYIWLAVSGAAPSEIPVTAVSGRVTAAQVLTIPQFTLPSHLFIAQPPGSAELTGIELEGQPQLGAWDKGAHTFVWAGQEWEYWISRRLLLPSAFAGDTITLQRGATDDAD